MTDRECDCILELTEMNDELHDINEYLRSELSDTQKDLIITLEKLVTYQEELIEELRAQCDFEEF